MLGRAPAGIPSLETVFIYVPAPKIPGKQGIAESDLLLLTGMDRWLHLCFLEIDSIVRTDDAVLVSAGDERIRHDNTISEPRPIPDLASRFHHDRAVNADRSACGGRG